MLVSQKAHQGQTCLLDKVLLTQIDEAHMVIKVPHQPLRHVTIRLVCDCLFQWNSMSMGPHTLKSMTMSWKAPQGETCVWTECC